MREIILFLLNDESKLFNRFKNIIFEKVIHRCFASNLFNILKPQSFPLTHPEHESLYLLYFIFQR